MSTDAVETLGKFLPRTVLLPETPLYGISRLFAKPYVKEPEGKDVLPKVFPNPPSND
jgi:hypothetical protein